MKKNFWEKIILILIILAVVHIFLDEFSRFDHWSVFARNNLMLAGFFLDIFFTMEFAVRILMAYGKNKTQQYIKYDRGWADFFGSIPLLILDFPAVYLFIYGIFEEGSAAPAFFTVFLFISDLRITRILRFIRVIKLSRKFPKASSPMTRHHTAAVSATVVVTIICSLAFFSFTGTAAVNKALERTRFYDESISLIIYLQNKSKISKDGIAKKMFSEDKNLLNLSYRNEIIISRISDEKFMEYFGRVDYAFVNNRGFVLQFSLADLNREEAYYNLIWFLIIILVSFSVLFIYSRHFADTVSSVISSVIMGFRSKQYSEQAKIRKEFEQDEVYKLAGFYNDFYLPAKLKRKDKGGIKS
jgi:hypothetical protein